MNKRYFGSSAMRDLNKFTIFYDGSPFFTAWTDQGCDFNVSFDQASFFGINSESLQTIGGNIGQLLAFAGQSGITSALGLGSNMAGISFAQKNMYKGTNCLEMNCKCYLLLRDSYEDDIKAPMEKLFEMLLPKMGEKMLLDDVLNAFNSQVKTSESKNQVNAGNVTGDPGGVLQALLKSAKTIIGDVHRLELPLAYRDLSKHLKIRIGRFTVDEITLSGMTIEVPPPIYAPESGDKPLVDHVQINFKFKTLRPVHSKTIEF